MLLLNLTLIMVLVFLAATLAVGLCFRGQPTTIREYAIGNKNFATTTLVATVLATAYGGGGLIRNIEMLYTKGLFWIIIIMVCKLDLWILRLLAIRMGPFMQHLSMAETMGSAYGKYARLLTVFASLASSLAAIALQIQAISIVLPLYFKQIDPILLSIGATLCLIAYSAFGGIRSVTFTDLFQCITFVIVIPCLAWFMLVNIKEPLSELLPFLKTQENFQYSKLAQDNMSLMGMASLILTFIVAYIRPEMIQRIYMASSPVQARAVFKYATVFNIILMVMMITIALAVAVAAPMLQKEAIWSYILAHIPDWFVGMVAISILAMAMSTADSMLNSATVMVCHDIPESIWGKATSHTTQMRWARLTTCLMGVAALSLTFYCKNLLELLQLSLGVYIPIITAPFILVVYGFRSSDRTALIGMISGALSIIAWNRWLSATGIDGSFPCMLVNGAAMLAAHYLLPQPAGAGWVGPSEDFIQVKQAAQRKQRRRKRAIQNFIKDAKLLQLDLKSSKILALGSYLLIVGFFTCFTRSAAYYWCILQFLFGSMLMLCALNNISFPARLGSIGWLTTLVGGIALPLMLQWYHTTKPLFTALLSITHWSIILWLNSLYIALPILAITLVVSIYPICLMAVHTEATPLFCILAAGIFALSSHIKAKLKINRYKTKIAHLKSVQAFSEDQARKQQAYALNIHPAVVGQLPKDLGDALEAVIQQVVEAISFLDDGPLAKEDFKSIIHKFQEWVLFLKHKEKAKDLLLLLPQEITLEKLSEEIERVLEKHLDTLPRLLFCGPPGSNAAEATITCDVSQILRLTRKVMDRILAAGKETSAAVNGLIRIAYHPTKLTYLKTDVLEEIPAQYSTFPAIACIISHGSIPIEQLPKVEVRYGEHKPKKSLERLLHQPTEDYIDLNRQAIEHIVYAHYGHVEIFETAPGILLIVLPTNVLDIRKEMVNRIPMDCFVTESDVTPEEQSEASIQLMHAHDEICRKSEVEADTMASILLLLRKCFGFTRHASGQLCYIRAVGIGQIVASWIPYSPKPIYAAMLYGAVRHTKLPSSYVKANFNLGVWAFIQQVLSVDSHKELEPSLLHIGNRFKKAADKTPLSVLYIKMADRIYDLEHAEGYKNKAIVKSMAQEALAIDVHLIRKYLEPAIADRLQRAAEKALAWSIKSA